MVTEPSKETGTGRRLDLLYWLLLGAGLLIISVQIERTGVAFLLLALVGLVVYRFKRAARVQIERLETERHRAELEESRYRTLVDHIDLGVTLIDADYRVQMVNAAQGRLFGRAPGDFVGKSCFREFEKRDSVCSHCPGTRAMASGRMHMVETRGLGAGGERLDVVIRAFPVPGQGGRPEGFIEVVENVTELRSRETDLRMARFTMDHAAESVFWIRADGSLTYVNEQACRSLGYEREELLTLSLFEVAPEHLAADWEHRRGEIQARESHTFETTLLRKDGGTFPVEVLASHLEAEDQEFTCLFARNITRRRKAEDDRLKLERQVQHTQKLESLGVMAGGIAHDFNNILMGVLGNAELALLRAPPGDPLVEQLRDIQIAATRAADLSRQMLAYSGKGLVQVKQLNLNQAMEEMTHLLESVISKKAMLTLDLSPQVPTIEADVTQVRQVIMNLITNASEAIADGVGVVRLRTGVVAADQALLAATYLDDDLSEGLYAFVEVSDTGAGMDAATRERIFDPFFTTKFTGRGLGLAAVLGIIRAHQGAIEIDSEPGKGTTIRVLFPCNGKSDGPRTESARGPSLDDWRGEGTVLVVDDEEPIRALARTSLEMAGFEVLLARDGQEGLERFQTHASRIVVVVLDMTMPRMDGEETFHRIRAIAPEAKVVLTSGYSEAAATEHFEGEGLAGFLQKPFTPSALLAKLRALLEAED